MIGISKMLLHTRKLGTWRLNDFPRDKKLEAVMHGIGSSFIDNLLATPIILETADRNFQR